MIRRFPVQRVLACAAVLAAAAHSVPAHARPQSELGARVDSYLARLVPWGFAGGVLVSRQGRVVLAAGYGAADRERGVSNTAQTAFPIAALSETFTAAAVLLLEERGALTLDDPLSRHLTGVPADKQPITLRQLLGHSAGLAPERAVSLTLPVSREEALTAILAEPLAATPGARVIRSSSGFVLLAAIVERAGEASFESFLAAQVFAPAGMGNTGFAGEPRWKRESVARGSASGVEQVAPADWTLSWPLRGSGAVLSTLGDLYRWERALSVDGTFSPALRRKLFTPVLEGRAPGSTVGADRDARQRIESDGTLPGIWACIRRYPDENMALIVLCNARSGDGELERVALERVDDLVFARAVAWPPETAPLDFAIARAASGVYELPAGGRLRLELERDRLMISAENQGGVDALTLASPEARAWQEDFGARTLQLVEVLRQRDFPAAASLLGSTAQAVDGELGHWWRRLEESRGACRNVKLLASSVRERAVTLRLEFERGAELRRVRWSGNKLAGIEPAEERYGTGAVWPLAAGGWVSFDPVSGARSEFGFLLRADQSVRALSFRGETAELIARRVE